MFMEVEKGWESREGLVAVSGDVRVTTVVGDPGPRSRSQRPPLWHKRRLREFDLCCAPTKSNVTLSLRDQLLN